MGFSREFEGTKVVLQKPLLPLKTLSALPQVTRTIFIGGRKFAIFSLLKCNAVELSAGSGYLQGICYLKRSKKVADTLKVSATRAIKIP
jgi:hypothetical protein